MLTIKNGRILLTRGDSAYINVELTTSTGEVYEMHPRDTLTLTVRKLADDTSAVLLQTESDSTQLHLLPAQTKQLTAGKYSYDIQLSTASGDVYTVVGAADTNTSLSNFTILPEVTT